MQNRNIHNANHWELISKIVSGEADANEHSLFDNLMSSNAEFEELFRQVKKDWDLVSSYRMHSDEEMDTAWMKQNERIHQYEKKRKKTTVKTIKMLPVLRYAASIALLFTMSFAGLKLYNYFQNVNSPEIITMYVENKNEFSLSDGTLITLNRGSRISYPEKFSDTIRNITLEGEAYFEVRHDEDRPFIIETSNAEIKVLGTSFNVLCDHASEKVEVFVADGKVQVTPVQEQSEPLILESGYLGVVTQEQSAMEVNQDQNYLAWKTGKVVFKRAPLEEVVKTLNKMYGVQISLHENVKNCLLTSTFTNKDLDTVLEIICTTLNLKMNKSAQSIHLSGTGC